MIFVKILTMVDKVGTANDAMGIVRSPRLSFEFGEYVQSGFGRRMADEQPVFETVNALSEPPVGGFNIGVRTQQYLFGFAWLKREDRQRGNPRD